MRNVAPYLGILGGLLLALTAAASDWSREVLMDSRSYNESYVNIADWLFEASMWMPAASALLIIAAILGTSFANRAATRHSLYVTAVYVVGWLGLLLVIPVLLVKEGAPASLSIIAVASSVLVLGFGRLIESVEVITKQQR